MAIIFALIECKKIFELTLWWDESKFAWEHTPRFDLKKKGGMLRSSLSVVQHTFLFASTKMWKNSCKHCSSNEGILGTNSPKDWKQGFLYQIYARTCFFASSQLDCRVDILFLTLNLLTNISLSPLPPPWISLSCSLYFSRAWKMLTCW